MLARERRLFHPVGMTPLQFGRRAAAITAALVIHSATVSGQVPLPALVNGSFESPNVGTATYGVAPGGWQDASTFGRIGLIPNSDPGYRDTTFGQQRISILDDGVAITQTVTGFVAGVAYSLCFYAATESSSGFGLPAAGLEVIIRGAANVARFVALPVRSTGPNDTVLWSYYELGFIPTADGSVTFQFGSSNPGPAIWTATVDNASIRLGIPESGSTGFLLGGGALALLLTAHQQQRRERARMCKA
jgi:hypothetical protein